MAHRATSIHHLNADRGLNKVQVGLYFLFNMVNNSFPYRSVDPNLKIAHFFYENVENYWSKLPLKSSPGRKLSDLFWMTLPWQAIKAELGSIHILDVGCGAGFYGERLWEWSNNSFASYTGIDASPHDNSWTTLKAKYPHFHFMQATAGTVSANIPSGTNFFMSQSAIEHFDDDLWYFEQIRAYILSVQTPVIQIHLFPSRACLKLYGAHGVRQYTPRTASKISHLFKQFSYMVLYGLGGDQVKHLHYEFITKPLRQRMPDQREIRPNEYDSRLLKAVRADMNNPSTHPGFYALVIHSHGQNRLF